MSAILIYSLVQTTTTLCQASIYFITARSNFRATREEMSEKRLWNYQLQQEA